MPPSEMNQGVNARRKLLGTLGASAVALLGLNAAHASTPEHTVPVPLPPAPANDCNELFSQARLRSYKSRRSSSWDRTGGNKDSMPIPAGQSLTLFDLAAAGVITHIWFTINSKDKMHLKNLVLRAWWDGEATPSVEVPIGDFFGLGLGEYFTYQSALLAVAPIKALNSYFQMPFATAAKVTLSNEGSIAVDSLYFAIDYVLVDHLPNDLGRFHAQYRQATPNKGWSDDWTYQYAPELDRRPNLDGADNYIFVEATGRGHFVGVTQSVLQNQDGWFGEGDDMIFIDGDQLPTINGTGTEDYYNGAWDFGKEAFSYPYIGAPLMVNPERIGGRCALYRWHLESPITFEKSIKVTIEHGHANLRSDNFYSTAYWYQTEPHAQFPALPKAEARIPRLYRAGKAGAIDPPQE